MTHARIITNGEERWRHDVVAVSAHRDYLTLHCASHPMEQHFWRGARDTSVLLCATDEDVTAALREEITGMRAAWRARSCTCLGIGRDFLCPVHGDYDKVGVR